LQEVVAPIQNKVGQFLSTALIRNIVGQTVSSFSIRDIMDSRKILILNLSKGRIGEDNSALLGAMMITKIQMAAMARVDIAEEERKDFYLYVDEFQNFATESFANILSEARKYRLNLILANQYVNQIDEVVRDSIFGNAGTIISFRVGAVDAEFLEKEYEPVFYINDIVNLPKYHIYLKLMIDGVAGDAFSATTLPPLESENTVDISDKAIRVSRERYASSQAEVEDKILRWSGVDEGVSDNTSSRGYDRQGGDTHRSGSLRSDAHRSQNRSHRSSPDDQRNQDSIERKPSRKLYDAKCNTCNIDIQVPFEPDGSRPTFCKDCLKDYQRSVAKKTESATKDDSQKNLSEVKEKPKRKRPPRPTKTVEPVVHTTEAPLKLDQFQYIAPKKFRNKGGSPEIDLGEVRNLIQKQKQATDTADNQ
jgi:CxxC-x17-CxxC domain-containing protein